MCRTALRLILLTALLALPLPSAFVAQPESAATPALTAEQKKQLKERDRYEAEAEKLRTAGKLVEAIAAAEKMLALERKVFGEVHDEVANSLERLGEMHEEREDWAKARTARERQLAIHTKLHGADHWRTVDARLALAHGDVLRSLSPEQRRQLTEATRREGEVLRLLRAGQSKPAVPLALQVVETRKKVLGETHPDYASSLNYLALLYKVQGNYAKAEPLYRQSSGIYKQALGEVHPTYATSLNDLALLYKTQADYGRAEPLYRQASEIYMKALGKAHPDYATSLNNLALLYKMQGDYAKAEPLLRQALGIVKVPGETHPGYAILLNNLADVYSLQGDYAKAEPLFRQALEIHKKVPGETHPVYAASLNNLAGLYDSLEDYARAEPLYRQALEIVKKALGETNPLYADSLNNLAVLYHSQGDHARAEPLFRQALEICKKALGETHPEYASSLNNLAQLYKAEGNFARAEPLFRQALEIRKKALGETHPDYADSLNNLAALYQRQGDHVTAEPLARQSLFIMRDHLDATAAIQSERQQLGMGDMLRSHLDAYLSIALDGKVPPERLAPLLSQAKGAVFVRQRRQRQILALAGRDGEPARLARELDRVSRRLATLAGATPEPGDHDAWRKQLAEFTEQKERLEADLSRLSTEFRTQKARERLTPEQLRDRLPADTALVDLFEYTHSTPDPKRKGKVLYERRLLALILRKDRPVTLVPLGPAQPVADAVERWRLTLKRTQPILKDDDPALVLRNQLWVPLAKHLAGVKTVLLAPDGATAQLPFAALPGSKPGSYLIEEIQLAILPVPQLLAEILDRKPDEADEPSLLLVGAVDYDAEAGKTSGLASKTAVRAGERKQWKPLEGTRTEMAAIKDSFEQRFPDGKVRALRGAQATEETLRELAPKHRWLHLATHGFFAPPTVKALGRSEAKEPRGGEGFGQREATGHPPGLLSGLVLAGANREPSPERDDGILTALEVQALDLRKVELAVLSACETGLGKVAGGEGVLGLQRAFQVAGAHTTVTSLWSVDDKATQQLMVRFYENRWEKKLPALEALMEAQRWMLAEGIKRGMVREPVAETGAKPRTPPYYWAAFVLSGDWR